MIKIGLKVILLFCICIPIYGQDSLNLSVTKNSLLTDVLADVSKEENKLFAFPSELLSDQWVEPTKESFDDIESFLDYLLNDKGLEFASFNDDQYLIRKAEKIESEKWVSGQIVDLESNQILPYATIVSSDFKEGALADENGKFQIKVDPNANRTYTISYLGYESKELTYSDLLNAKSFGLGVKENMISSVTIQYICPPVMIDKGSGRLKLGSKLLSLETSGIYGSDIIRNLQLMPGVAAHDDDSASLKVRGSNAEDSQIILDGIPLYNANHYYNIFSAVNGSYIETAELFKNHQPIDIQSTGGGVLILDSGWKKRDKNNSININLLTTSASLDLDAGENGRFHAAFRSSYRNVNDARLLDLNSDNVEQFNLRDERNSFITTDPEFRFADINLSYRYATDKFGIGVNVFRSEDRFKNEYELKIDLPRNEFSKLLYENNEDWENGGLSIVSYYKLGKRWTLNTTFYASRYEFSSVLNSTIQGRNEQTISTQNSGSIQDNGLKIFSEYLQEDFKLIFGVEGGSYKIGRQLSYDASMSAVDYSDRIILNTFFLNAQKSFGNFTLNAGFRAPSSKQKDKFKSVLSPQLSGNYAFNDDFIFKFSLSHSNQVLRELEYETRLGQNLKFFGIANSKDVPILKTDKLMVGGNWGNDKFNFDVELFYKRLDGIMQLTYSRSGFDGNGLGVGMYNNFKGERRVAGLDVLLSYRNKNYQTWLAYTLSKSEDRFAQLFKGDYFLSQDDRRHQFKYINIFKYKKFDFNLNIIFSSGRPYLAFEALAELMDKDQLDLKKNQRSLPSYIRSDIGINYNFKLGANNGKVGLSIFNLANRQNVKFIQYSYKIETQNNNLRSIVLGTQGDLLDRTLNLSFQFDF